MPIKIRTPEQHYQITKAACVSNITTPSKKQQITRAPRSYSSWWWTHITKEHNHVRMAQYIKEIPPVLQPYWTFCKKLTIEDGLILKGTRIVIPSKNQEALLNQIHNSHLGLTSVNYKQNKSILARFKWPAREACAQLSAVLKVFQFQEETRNKPIIRPRNSTFSMDKISNWLIPFQRRLIFITCWLYKLVSYHTQVKINDWAAHCWSFQADLCQIWVARYNSIWQWTLLHQWNLQRVDERISSKPHHKLTALTLQSNGLAEKYVQIVKRLFHKAKEEGQDLHKCFMVYRNTPLSSQLQSPMQILSSRAARSSLPLSNAAKKQMGIQSIQLRCGHKNQDLPSHDVSLNRTVMYQEPVSKKWYPAKITKLCDESRSYIITTE